MTATASSIAAIIIDDTAAFFIFHAVSSIVYHADGKKEKCDLRRKAATFR
jgi:hypothetical protein